MSTRAVPLVVRLVVVALMGVPLTLLGSAAAVADGPTAAGWWNLAHQQFPPPAPPDVGPQDLYLQGGSSAPTAYAALRFAVSPDATVGALVLPLSSATAQRADGVQACPTTEAWEPERNAPYAEAPAYSCARSVTAALSEDGKALVLAGIARLLADDGSLDVALVPGPSDRVVLAPPPSTALAVTPPPADNGSGPPPEPPPTFVAGPAPATGGFTPEAPSFPGQPPQVPGFDPPPLVPVPAPVPTAPPVVGPPAAGTAPVALSAPADDNRTRLLVLAEALLVLVFFGLLGYGPLQRLQALTGEPVPVEQRPRGIGRFASVRSTDQVPHL